MRLCVCLPLCWHNVVRIKILDLLVRSCVQFHSFRLWMWLFVCVSVLGSNVLWNPFKCSLLIIRFMSLWVLVLFNFSIFYAHHVKKNCIAIGFKQDKQFLCVFFVEKCRGNLAGCSHTQLKTETFIIIVLE